MTLDDDLDTLYGVAPEGFTALRKELTAAAKKRGDPDAAAAIAAARRPTAAAWVVNRLVRAQPTAKVTLGELTAQLRAAHAALDGVRIRELSTAQRTLVGELVRAGFAAAGVDAPSAALRDDVTSTLQAAIADPDVAARLGRLEKAQEWSGFGDFGGFGELGELGDFGDSAETVPPRAPTVDPRAIEAAEEVRAAAAAQVADRTTALRTARRRYEKLLETLSAAEDAVNIAEGRLHDANDELAQADSSLAALRRESPT